MKDGDFLNLSLLIRSRKLTPSYDKKDGSIYNDMTISYYCMVQNIISDIARRKTEQYHLKSSSSKKTTLIYPRTQIQRQYKRDKLLGKIRNIPSL